VDALIFGNVDVAARVADEEPRPASRGSGSDCQPPAAIVRAPPNDVAAVEQRLDARVILELLEWPSKRFEARSS